MVEIVTLDLRHTRGGPRLCGIDTLGSCQRQPRQELSRAATRRLARLSLIAPAGEVRLHLVRAWHS